MQKQRTLVLILSLLILTVLIGTAGTAQANNLVGQADQMKTVKDTTKHVAHRTHRKGRYVVKTTWHNGKKVTKRVWVKSNSTAMHGARTVKHHTKRAAQKVKNAVH